MMEYYRFFVDVWRFFKRYYQSAVDKDAWWDGMVGEAGSLTEKYGQRRFALDIMCAIVNELERRVRPD